VTVRPTRPTVSFNERKDPRLETIDRPKEAAAVLADYGTQDEFENYQRRPPQTVRWAREGRSRRASGKVLLPEASAVVNNSSLGYDDHEDHHSRSERQYELDNSNTQAAPPWRRHKRQQPLSDDEDNDIERPPFSPSPGLPSKTLTSPAKSTAKKPFVGKILSNELEQRKHLKERWNREYDKRVAAAGGNNEGGHFENRGTGWADSNAQASAEYYSDYASSNEDGGPAGQPCYDEVNESRRYGLEEEGVKQRRHYQQMDGEPLGSRSSYPYNSAPTTEKDVDVRSYHRYPHYLQEPQRGHRQRHPQQPTVEHPRYRNFSLDAEDDPRDVDIRQLPQPGKAVTTAGVHPATSSAFQRSAYPPRASLPRFMARGAGRGQYRPGPRAEEDEPLSTEDKDSKTTYYHHNKGADEEESEERKNTRRKVKGQNRSTPPHRELSRESVSSASSQERRQKPLRPRLQSNKGKEKISVKEDKEPKGQVSQGRKRAVSNYSSEDEDRDDTRGKLKQAKRKTKTKPTTMQRCRSGSARSPASELVGSSSCSSTSSRHSSAERLLEQQQQHKQEATAKLADFCKKGSLLSKVTEILNSCMDLKLPAKAPTTKRSAPGAAGRQREPKSRPAASQSIPGSEEKDPAHQQKVSKMKQKNSNNTFSKNNSNQSFKEEKRDESVAVEAAAAKDGRAQEEGRRMPPTPVPPPAQLLGNRPLLKATAKADSAASKMAGKVDSAATTMTGKVDGSASVAEQSVLEEGEIHGTDGDEVIIDVEDNISERRETTLAPTDQLEEQQLKKVNPYYFLLISVFCDSLSKGLCHEIENGYNWYQKKDQKNLVLLEHISNSFFQHLFCFDSLK
jgi:hypothetical protein